MPADTFKKIADDWITSTLTHRPEGATRLGIHDHDGELGNRSRDAIEERAGTLHALGERITALKPDKLPKDERSDYELLRRRMLWELVTIEDLAQWRRSPGGYLASIGSGLNGLIIRDFAPLATRAQSAISRLSQVPPVLDQAKANLQDCPRIPVENAIEQAAGLRRLLEKDLPKAFDGLDKASLRSEFEDANRSATDALDGFAAWLNSDLLPRSDGDYAYGPERFRQLLSYADFVDRPLDELEQRARDDLRATQDQLRTLTAQIEPGAATSEVVDRVSQDHPTPQRLIPDTEALLEELRQFAIDHRMATMPTDVRIRVAETPSFARMTTQAACSTPGTYESKATEAYYYVTPPDPSWPPERTEAYLKFFNRYSLPGITAHEAYPGHYVHISWLHKSKNKLPHFLGTTTTTEGWAHYVEQNLIESGYGDGDPRYHVMQLREALLRLCRYLVSFGLHTGGWTFDEAVNFFGREGYATRPIAEREARRGVMGPQYYAYTLGKHEILALREKLKEKQGADYDQLAFHDAFMRLPYPISIIEERLLEQEA